jgi:hypothetical protein
MGEPLNVIVVGLTGLTGVAGTGVEVEPVLVVLFELPDVVAERLLIAASRSLTWRRSSSALVSVPGVVSGVGRILWLPAVELEVAVEDGALATGLFSVAVPGAASFNRK